MFASVPDELVMRVDEELMRIMALSCGCGFQIVYIGTREEQVIEAMMLRRISGRTSCRLVCEAIEGLHANEGCVVSKLCAENLC